MAKEKLEKVRSAVYLVESSNMKSPPKSAYGTDDNLFCNTCIGDGYIPRNIRLMKSFLDLVQPSVHFELPKINTNSVSLSFKVNGCLNINRLDLKIQQKDGSWQTINKLQGDSGYVCNYDLVKKQSIFTQDLEVLKGGDISIRFEIELESDKNWASQTSPVPAVKP